MRRFFVFLLLTLWSITTMAQISRITVMHYNLLQYGTSYGGCTSYNNNIQHKDECIRTILDYVKPDVFSVCEFGKDPKLQADFLKNNLNIGSVNYWKSDNILSSTTIINHIFYDSRKMELKKHFALYTSPRNSDVYEFYLKTSALVAGDTIKLVCIVTHPKAGTGTSNENDRYQTMKTIMDCVNQRYSQENVLVMGDFNIYGDDEPAYQVLTHTYGNQEALFVDPLEAEDGVGSWNNDSKYAQFHTQSTRNPGNDCFSTGGMDDRFDMILVSDEIAMCEKKIQYIDQSYYAVGNDGRHFNQSINQNGNSAVPANVAQALYDSSDHLPVSLKLRIHGDVGLEENQMTSYRVYPNPTTDILTVDYPGKATYRIMNLMGQTLMSGSINGESQQIHVSELPNGFYFISVNGVISKFVKSSALY